MFQPRRIIPSPRQEPWRSAPQKLIDAFSRTAVWYFCFTAVLALLMGVWINFSVEEDFDSRLTSTARAFSELLPPDFVDRAFDARDAVPGEKNRSGQIPGRTSALEEIRPLLFAGYEGKPYVARLAADGTAHSPSAALFLPHAEAPPEFSAALKTMRPATFSYANEQGAFRVHALPRLSPGGIRHLVCAEVGEAAITARREKYQIAGIFAVLLCVFAVLPSFWSAYRTHHVYAGYSHRMRLLVESAQDGIIALDGRNRILYANPAALRLLGCSSQEELLNRDCDELLNPSAGADPEEEGLRRLTDMNGGKGLCACSLRRLDGPLIQAELFLTPILDEDSPFSHLIFFRDITSSLNLREMTKAIYNSSADVHTIWQDGRMAECSPSAPQLFGVKNDEELERGMRENAFFPPFQPDGTASEEADGRIRERFAHSGFERFEWMYVDSAGLPLPCEITLNRISFNGRAATFSCVRDLRKLKLSEESLREERRQLLAILSKTPVGIGIYDTEDKTFCFSNPRLHELIPMGEGKTLDEMCADPRELDGIPGAPEENRNHVENHPLKLFSPSGKPRDFLFSSSPIHYEGRDDLLFWLVDVTKMRETEAALRAARDAAEETTRAKSDFLARMSHEIRTPMNGVIGMTYLALLQDPPEKLREYLEKIQSSATGLLGIINDILDFSKIEAGKLDVEYVPFVLNEQLDSVRDVLAEKMQAKGLRFVTEVREGIPGRIVGDPLRLRQILLNLTSNAMKFTERGEIRLNIARQRAEDGQEELFFSVADSGIGMTREQLSRIFESFTQADGSTTRLFGGTGLGLAIVKALVELMGGTVWAKSKVGEGSTFFFTMPLRLPETEEEPPQREKSAAREDPAYSGAHLLLVEDNEINREIALELLTLLGFSVDTAENGAEAVEVVRAGHYDLVLMDLQMPVMDGFEAARRIRAEGTPETDRLPIIAMTANAMAEDRNRCLAAGMNDHISKPIDPELLYTTLRRWLKKREDEKTETRADGNA
jgi:PAS domain S-box-containing protein